MSDMSDADREWTIEHAGEQLYDTSACSTTTKQASRYGDRTATDPTTVEQENGARLSRPWRHASEFGRLSRQRAEV
jgi:hypothetical protein